MDYRTHRLAGICTGAVVSSLVVPTPYVSASIGFYGLITVSAAIGSYLPDIDEPSSKVGKVFKPVSMLAKGVAGHRGMFHTPIMAILLLLGLVALKNYYARVAYLEYFEYFLLGIISGFLSHLFVDSLTVSGVPWLWPISQKRISIAPLHTSNKFHQLIVQLSFIIIAFVVVWMHSGPSFSAMLAGVIS